MFCLNQNSALERSEESVVVVNIEKENVYIINEMGAFVLDALLASDDIHKAKNNYFELAEIAQTDEYEKDFFDFCDYLFGEEVVVEQ